MVIFSGVCGSVANSESGEATMCAAGWELRGHAEDDVGEFALRDSIARSHPADLTFADCVHRGRLVLVASRR